MNKKFVIDSFEQIKSLFQRCDESKHEGFYDLDEWFFTHIDLNKLKYQIRQQKRFNEDPNNFQHNRGQQVLLSLLKMKWDTQRNLNRLGLKINNGLATSGKIFLTFSQQLYRLYNLDKIIQQVFRGLIDDQIRIEQIEKSIKQIHID